MKLSQDWPPVSMIMSYKAILDLFTCGRKQTLQCKILNQQSDEILEKHNVRITTPVFEISNFTIKILENFEYMQKYWYNKPSVLAFSQPQTLILFLQWSCHARGHFPSGIPWLLAFIPFSSLFQHSLWNLIEGCDLDILCVAAEHSC